MTTHLQVPVLARVEGEGAMHVTVTGDEVTDVRLEIYEPPRLVEALLRGRRYDEPVDITARICGICPAAYQMSACHAIERACGVDVAEAGAPGGVIRDLRRLLSCGEWIQSHVLHIGLLHAPDFLGYDSGIDLAADHRDRIEALLALKKAGNDVLAVLGGRPIHPVNVRLGGFHRAPASAEMDSLRQPLRDGRLACLDMIRWTAGFEFPDLERDDEFVSLRHGGEYPMNEGRIVSDRGLDIDPRDFEDHIGEYQVAHSTALHSRLVGTGSGNGRYQVGPLARWANNADVVPASIRALATEVGIGAVETNPFRTILVRGLETLLAVEEALHIIDHYRPPAKPSVDVPAGEGEGWAATEAPRGLLYHRYRLHDGVVAAARLIPPTSQNQRAIEADLEGFVSRHLHLPPEDLVRRCEQVIRNYDPCISCATHFLDLHIEQLEPVERP